MSAIADENGSSETIKVLFCLYKDYVSWLTAGHHPFSLPPFMDIF
jgi:hypothetical protein